MLVIAFDDIIKGRAEDNGTFPWAEIVSHFPYKTSIKENKLS